MSPPRLPNEILFQILDECMRTVNEEELEREYADPPEGYYAELPKTSRKDEQREEFYSALSLSGSRLFLEFARQQRFSHVAVDCIPYRLSRAVDVLRREEVARCVEVMDVTLYDEMIDQYLVIEVRGRQRYIKVRDRIQLVSLIPIDTTATNMGFWTSEILPHLRIILKTCSQSVTHLSLESTTSVSKALDAAFFSAMHKVLAETTFKKVEELDISTASIGAVIKLLADPMVRRHFPALHSFGIQETVYYWWKHQTYVDTTTKHSGKDICDAMNAFSHEFRCRDLKNLTISQNFCERNALWQNVPKGLDPGNFTKFTNLESLYLIELRLSNTRLSTTLAGFKNLKNLTLRRISICENEDRWTSVFAACAALSHLKSAYLQGMWYFSNEDWNLPGNKYEILLSPFAEDEATFEVLKQKIRVNTENRW